MIKPTTGIQHVPDHYCFVYSANLKYSTIKLQQNEVQVGQIEYHRA